MVGRGCRRILLVFALMFSTLVFLTYNIYRPGNNVDADDIVLGSAQQGDHKSSDVTSSPLPPSTTREAQPSKSKITDKSTPQPPSIAVASGTNTYEVTRMNRRVPSKSVQQEKMCDVKYPPATLAMLKRTLAIRRVRRVAIMGNFKDCAKLLPSVEEAVLQVADVLSSENVFVSFLESGSRDQTPADLRGMADRLQAHGVSNIISTGKNPITAVWRENISGGRIDFLARIRNAAMMAAFYSHPVGHFDKFFFINDVYMCGGDILRLLAHDADIACGLDYNHDNDAVWDAWVMEGYDTERINSTSRIKNVFACWNGGVASKAALFYNGIRFREGMKELGQEDCSQSECSLWSMDAHKLGYHNIIIDPSVQSGYAWSNYIKNFRDSSPEVKEAVISPNVYTEVHNNLQNITYRCCELTGSKRYIDWGKCHKRQLLSPNTAECERNTTKCLHYVPSRWEEDWDWKSLLKWGKGVSIAPASNQSN